MNKVTNEAKPPRLLQAEQFAKNFKDTNEVLQIIELLRTTPPTTPDEKKKYQAQYDFLLNKINNELPKHVKPTSKNVSPRYTSRTRKFTHDNSAIPSTIKSSQSLKNTDDFTYHAITANCANKVFGKNEAAAIKKNITDNPADFYVINCQNVEFLHHRKDPTLLILSQNLPANYSVKRVSEMRNSKLNNNTGMACYVIYDTKFEIDKPDRSKARSTDYQHGGMITRFQIKEEKTDKVIAIESTTAFLSKNKPIADWYAVNHTQAHGSVTKWDDLCEMTPTLCLEGIETNIKEQAGKPKWDTPQDFPETWALKQTLIDNHRLTSNLRKSNFITISDATSSPRTSKPNAVAIDSSGKILMSDPLTVATKIDDFTRVRNYIANRLQASAPLLAKDISQLTDTPENRVKLIKIHNTFLSKSGVLDLCLKLASNEKPNKVFKGKAWLGEVSIDNFGQHDVTDRLIHQIGDYGDIVKNSDTKLALLSPDAKDALFAKKVKFNKPSFLDSDDGDPKRHRTAFVKYLMQRDASFEGRTDDERIDLLTKENGIKKASINMEDLLGKEGIRLYQKALEEERNSEEYLTAVFCKATKHYEGKSFKAPIGLGFGGPSGGGKSYNAGAIVTRFMEILGDKDNQNGADVVSIDGGIPRDVAQMPSLVIQLANKKNYTYIRDLKRKSKCLDSVKESLFEAAKIGGVDDKPLSTVSPLTFSELILDKAVLDYQAKRFLDDLQAAYGNNYYYSLVTDVDPITVENQGIARSAETKFETTQYEYDLNKSTCESKEYSAGPLGISFKAGVIGSDNVERVYFDRKKGAISLHVANSLRLYVPVDSKNLDGDWKPATIATAPLALRINQKLFDDWTKTKNTEGYPQSLPDYYAEHWKDSKYEPVAEAYNRQGKVVEGQNEQPSIQQSPGSEFVDKRTLEANRIKTLITHANTTLSAIAENPLSFDPQGRVLVDVPDYIVQVMDREPDDNQQLSVTSLKTVFLIRDTDGSGNVSFRIGYSNQDGQYNSVTAVPLTGQENFPVGAVITSQTLLNQIRAALPNTITLPNLQANTTVSYDISWNDDLKRKFAGKIKNNISAIDSVKEKIFTAYDNIENKGCIIPLQQEFHFHLRLALRVYAKEVVSMSEEQFQKIHDETMCAVNVEVMAEFGAALQKAFVNEAINIAILNKELDKARNTILPIAHRILLEKTTRIANEGKSIKALSSDEVKELKHTAETTTATSNDLLHLDNSMGLATVISGTDVTAHDRDFGVDHVADVQVRAYAYDPFNLANLDPNPIDRIQVGVPSLAVKNIKALANGEGDVELNYPLIIARRAINRNAMKTIEEPVEDAVFKRLMADSLHSRSPIFIQDEVKNTIYYKNKDQLVKLTSDQITKLLEFVLAHDVREKISYLSEKYFNKPASDSVQSTKPQAFIYNLYTSINEGMTGNIDESLNKNFQTESLKAILAGALLHNRQQLLLKTEGVTPPYCFVQAIAVNGHGAPLDPNSRNPLIKEATLMTEMALLHTIYDSVDEILKNDINEVFKRYETFLGTKKLWFALDQSNPLTEIEKIKEKLKTANLSSDASTLGLARKALVKILCDNNHHTRDGRLIQALSVFCEEQSINGCKSRNERTQMVNSRVQLLDANNQQVLIALRKFVANPAAIFFERLEAVFDEQCNENNLYGSASLISNKDQGASAKIQPRKEGVKRFFTYLDTNKGEASIMSNLSQHEAKKMQSHNGMTSSMEKAVKQAALKEPLFDRITTAYARTVSSISSISIKKLSAVFVTVGVIAAVIVSVFVPPILPFVIAAAGLAVLGTGAYEVKLWQDKKVENEYKQYEEEEIVGSSRYLGNALQGGIEQNKEHLEDPAPLQNEVEAQLTSSNVHNDDEPNPYTINRNII